MRAKSKGHNKTWHGGAEEGHGEERDEEGDLEGIKHGGRHCGGVNPVVVWF